MSTSTEEVDKGGGGGGGNGDGDHRRCEDIGVQTDLPSAGGRFCCGRRRWLMLTVAVAVLAVVVPFAFYRVLAGRHRRRHGGWYVSELMLQDVGMDGVILFKQHDRDMDGVLSIEEFEPLAHRLALVNVNFTYS